MKLKSKFASAVLKSRKELGYTQREVAEVPWQFGGTQPGSCGIL